MALRGMKALAMCCRSCLGLGCRRVIDRIVQQYPADLWVLIYTG